MLYRFARAFNELYGITVFALFVMAFLVAFAFTLVYPIVPIVLLFTSIFAVVFFTGLNRLLRAVERRLARRGLERGTCPACREPLAPVDLPDGPGLDCTGCARIFRPGGELWLGDPDAPVEAMPAGVRAVPLREPGDVPLDDRM
jgi:hypothetical protein